MLKILTKLGMPVQLNDYPSEMFEYDDIKRINIGACWHKIMIS